MASAILLQKGTILIHDEHDHVHTMKADLLVEGNIISKIEADINSPENCTIIDCANKIISPGFIDTHHHVWQTLLKGRHADDTLFDYFGHGNYSGGLHDATDTFWGELGGVLECIDVGTTTVVDHAHINYSPGHTKAAIAATVSSGIRSVFGYCPVSKVETWVPFKFKYDMLADWVFELLQELGAKAPFGDGRVQLGLAFDGLWLPKDVLTNVFQRAREAGVKIITSHYVYKTGHFTKLIKLLDDYDFLDSSFIISHASNIEVDEAAILRKTNAHVSVTPSSELQMGHGETIAFHKNLGIQDLCSLGVDCHSNNNASIPGQMDLLLQHARAVESEKFIEVGKIPKAVFKTVDDVFNLGTINGARTLKMEDKIGSLAVGKFADIVVFDATSPSMVCGAQHNPIATIVQHSTPRDIDMVIVDGIIRKQDGKLSDVDIKAGRNLWAGEERDSIEWPEVAKILVERRALLQEKLDKIDFEAMKPGIAEAFQIPKDIFADKI